MSKLANASRIWIKGTHPITGQKHLNICFEDLLPEEQDAWLDKLDAAALKRLAKRLAETIKEITADTVKIDPDEFEALKKRLDEKGKPEA